MEITKFASKIFIVIFVVLLAQFLYFGISNSLHGIYEGDSIAYHIPIAEKLASGSLIPPVINQGLGFYPAASEAILAIFVLLHLPLNLFGVLGFGLLFYFSKKVGESFGISKEMSVVYAGVIVTLQSVLRWPLSQIVDIWLDVFFLGSLLRLNHPKTSTKFYLLLGIYNGFLIGTKYSGPLYLVVLLAIFGKSTVKNLNFQKLVAYLVPTIIIGFSWYIRNFILTGNPFYPANLFFLKGDPSFYVGGPFSWSVLANIIKNPGFVLDFINALITEFLSWTLVLVLPLIFIFRKKLQKNVRRLILTGGLIFFIFITLLLGVPIVSNLRYIYPAMSILILSVFIMFKNKFQNALIALSIITAGFSLINLEYHPKILVLAFLPAFYLVFIHERLNLHNRI